MIKKPFISNALPEGTILKNPKKWGSRAYIIKHVISEGGDTINFHSKSHFYQSHLPTFTGDQFITYLASSCIKVGNISHKIYFAIKEYWNEKCHRERETQLMKNARGYEHFVEGGIEAFLAKALQLKKICDGNESIVKVSEVFKANNTAYCVMEYLDGGDLRDKLRNNGHPFSFEEALSYLTPISNAISYIHNSYKILHCDIKPDNIMFRVDHEGNETPVLIDFGSSMHFNKIGNHASFRTTSCVSEGYSPPEQYEKVFQFCPEVDVYALSATFFYLLTGHDPINAFEISDNYIDTYLPHSLDNHIREAIQKGMQANPAKRLHSVSEFMDGLSSSSTIFSGKPEKASRPSPTLITFINDKSLLIYFKRHSYVYGWPVSSDGTDDLIDMPLSAYPKEKDIYELEIPRLKRLTRFPEKLTQHITRYKNIIDEGKNYALFSQLENFVLLSKLCCSSNPLIKVERLMHECQIVAFSLFLKEDDSMVRVNIDNHFMDVEYDCDIFKICDIGYNGKSFGENKPAKKITMLDPDFTLNYVIDGLNEYIYCIKNKCTKKTFLQAFPYTIGWVKADRRCEEDVVIISPLTFIPYRKTTIIEGEYIHGSLSLFFLDPLRDSRKWIELDVKNRFGYIPTKINLTVDIDARHSIVLLMQDINSNKVVKCIIGDILNNMNSDS